MNIFICQYNKITSPQKQKPYRNHHFATQIACLHGFRCIPPESNLNTTQNTCDTSSTLTLVNHHPTVLDGASRELVRVAHRQSDVHTVIELPDSWVGRGGVQSCRRHSHVVDGPELVALVPVVSNTGHARVSTHRQWVLKKKAKQRTL